MSGFIGQLLNNYFCMKQPKIAFVKQEIYQDLYVCSKEEKNAANILFSSQMRVGPIGLMAELNADFIIVKEEYNRETQLYRKVIPSIAKYLYILKTQTADKMPGSSSVIVPGSIHANGEYAISCYDIDWSVYDIVISINISLPTTLILKYPNVLFAYMIGEANFPIRSAFWGYDVSLNQEANGKIATNGGNVEFPYTFLKGNTLEKIICNHLNRPSKKSGVYMEINSTKERPVTTVPPHFEPLVKHGYPINLHHQNIADNLVELYDSKYFVKMGGRKIRGNSVAEAISAGVLAIMNRDEIIHKQLIIDECNVKTIEDVINLLEFLDNNPDTYKSLLNKQRKLVDDLFFEAPLKSLINSLEYKRKCNHHHSLFDKTKDIIVLWCISFYMYLKQQKKYIKKFLK
ncbi:hypothetical protein FACS1894156_2720 [Bacteroidia bacterium]|nr:hypothetical protein FACS1894156_2720 [Bacteroidia bacterium]